MSEALQLVEVGRFFSSADVEQTSDSAYNYTNLASINCITLSQVDQSSNSYNPHPNAHLSSGVVSDDSTVYRAGGPSYISSVFNGSNLALPLSELSLANRNKRVSFRLYIPSSAALALSNETTTGIGYSELYYIGGRFVLDIDNDRHNYITYRISHSGGTVYPGVNFTFDEWHKIVITYDVDSDNTVYCIDDDENQTYSIGGDYLINYWFSSTGIQLYSQDNALRANYFNYNDLKLADLVYELTDLVILYEPPVPLQSSYSDEVQGNSIRTTMFDGRSRQRSLPSALRPYRKLNCQFLLTDDELAEFQSYLDDNCNGGADWFELQVLGDNDILETKEVRLINGEYTVSLVHNKGDEVLWRLTADFEVR